MAPEKLQLLQLKKFQHIFQWAYGRSKFRRGLYDKAGLTDAADLGGLKRISPDRA